MMHALMSATGGAAKLYVDDVFSAYTYTGNGSTQTITNGIDLAGKGGMVWTKWRASGFTPTHNIVDTVRGLSNKLDSSSTAASTTYNNFTALSTGYQIGDGSGDYNNSSFSTTYISWTFRKAPKFFDVVTYTGDGNPGRQIAHSLGIAPGMILFKRTDAAASWVVYSRGVGNTAALYLERTDAAFTSSLFFNNTDPTATNFTISSGGGVNASGGTYVAYLFAHDTSADGIIQCGSFAANGSGGASVTLGWEPQFVLQKASNSATSSYISNSWYIVDSMRGMSATAGNQPQIRSDSSAVESNVAAGLARPNATGFTVENSSLSSGDTYIYLAIRRPNKPPTTGTQVYNAIARTGTSAAATVTGVGFAPDLALLRDRAFGSYPTVFIDRLRGNTSMLSASQTNAESSFVSTDLVLDSMDGVRFAAPAYNTAYYNQGGAGYINHFFRRAPGVFDVVCYLSDGNSSLVVPHSLSVTPELVIVKARGLTTSWATYHKDVGNTKVFYVNSDIAPVTSSAIWNNTSPTVSSFTVGTGNATNSTISGNTYVAYLFAPLPGVSKVGSYTGNGSSQTINCGFSTGARFVLIKRTDSTGDWYVWDTARGIVSANDPHLSLNTTAAEVTTDDSIDPDSSGFIVNQLAATNINVTSASYIFLSFS